ncbi:transposase [Rhizobium ruizarguesonis]
MPYSRARNPGRSKGLDALHPASPCRMRDASDLTDREWSLMEPFMPKQPRPGRRRKTSRRVVIDAIFYLPESGGQWASLPHDFPPKSTVYLLFQAVLPGRDVASYPRRAPLPKAAA